MRSSQTGQVRPVWRRRPLALMLGILTATGVALTGPAASADTADATATTSARVTSYLGGCNAPANGAQRIDADGLRQIEDEIATQTNALRVEHGRAPLARNADIDAVAREWSRTQAAVNGMHHSPKLGATRMPEGFSWTSEILAYAWGADTEATEFMDLWIKSTVHRNNLLNTSFTHHGVGVAINDRGCVFATQNFGVYPRGLTETGGEYQEPTPNPVPTKPVPVAPSPPPVRPNPGESWFYLNDGWTVTANRTFEFGQKGDQIYAGDWDGDGDDTLAVRRGSTFYFSNTPNSSTPDLVVTYGRPGDVVLVGDWDGNGTDTLAVRRGQVYHLRDTISTGPADRLLAYGKPDDVVLVGNWDGRGGDSLAVRRGQFYLIANSLRSGPAELTVAYGKPNDVVIVGDWDGNGTDTFTVRRGAQYLRKNDMTTGVADKTLVYGRPDDDIIVGDWDGNREDTLGVRRIIR